MGKPQKEDPKKVAVTLYFTEADARAIIDAVGIKRAMGNLCAEGDAIDRAALAIAVVLHKGLRESNPHPSAKR
jgi:hypothetical protein